MLRAALAQIELRAAKLPEPAMRAAYPERRSENRRAFALAKARLGVAE